MFKPKYTCIFIFTGRCFCSIDASGTLHFFPLMLWQALKFWYDYFDLPLGKPSPGQKPKTGQMGSLILELCILDCWKSLCDFVISITCSVLVGTSRNLQIRWTWMKSHMFKNWLNRIIESYTSLIAEKASVWLCHQYKIKFWLDLPKFADKRNMDEISDKFENWPDWIINLWVASPWLLKMPLTLLSA